MRTSRSKTSVRTPSPPLPDCASHTPCSEAASASPAAAAGREDSARRGARCVQRQTLGACEACLRRLPAVRHRVHLAELGAEQVVQQRALAAALRAHDGNHLPPQSTASALRLCCGARATRLVVQAPASEARVLHERVKLGRDLARARQKLTLRCRGRHRALARAQRRAQAAASEHGAGAGRGVAPARADAPRCHTFAGTLNCRQRAHPPAGCGSAWSGAARCCAGAGLRRRRGRWAAAGSARGAARRGASCRRERR